VSCSSISDESVVSAHEVKVGLKQVEQFIDASTEFNSDTIYYIRSVCEGTCPILEPDYSCICLCYTRTNKLVMITSKYQIKLVSELDLYWDEIQLTAKEKAECKML
jgi:hypothetical protein